MQKLADVDAAAMQVAFPPSASCRSPSARLGHVDPDIDPRTIFVEAGKGCGQDGFSPCRAGGDTEAARPPRPGGVRASSAASILAQDSPRENVDGVAQRGQAHPVRQTLEEPASELGAQAVR